MLEEDGFITGEIMTYVHPFCIAVFLDTVLFMDEVSTKIFWDKSGFVVVEYLS